MEPTEVFLDAADIEFFRYVSLRQSIENNLQLADNKAHALCDIFTAHGQNLTPKHRAEFIKMYLDVICPSLDVDSAPEGYVIFQAVSNANIKHQCKVCADILERKYQIINRMVRFVEDHMI